MRPTEVEGQRAAGLRFGDLRVQALFAVLVMFSLQFHGFTNKGTRRYWRNCWCSIQPNNYDILRLRLHGMIERIPRSHRYRLTPEGLRIALFSSRTYAPAQTQTRSDHSPARPARGDRSPRCFRPITLAVHVE